MKLTYAQISAELRKACADPKNIFNGTPCFIEVDSDVYYKVNPLPEMNDLFWYLVDQAWDNYINEEMENV